MRVKGVNAVRRQPGRDARIQPRRDRNEIGRLRRDHFVMPHAAGKRRLGQDVLQDPLDSRRLVIAHAANLKPNVRANREAILAACASVCRG